MMLQLPDSMKQSQADLYLETYQVLDLEMSRLREIQRWQVSAASKVRYYMIYPFVLFVNLELNFHLIMNVNFSIQLAADMQRFSRPERRINGPTITHLWCIKHFFVLLLYCFQLENLFEILAAT